MDNDESVLKFEQYLKRRFPDRRTTKDYLCDVHQFMVFRAKPWREVSMQDMDAFVDDQRQKGLQTATVNRRVAALKTFFDFLAEDSGDLGWPNPVRFKRHGSKRGRHLPRDVSNEVVEQVWNVITDLRDRAWFAVILRAGLRVGEVVSLNMKDVLAPSSTEKPAHLRVEGKGRKERVVLLSSDGYAVLQEWLSVRPQTKHSQVFLNDRGHPFSTSGIEWLLSRYAQQVGVEVTPHQLRHTYARQLTEAHMPLPSLSKLMGHSQVTTTQIYTAGADPELSRAYQDAMRQMSSLPTAGSNTATGRAAAPGSSAEQKAALPEEPPTPEKPSLAHVEPPAPAPLPDWEAWATDLPVAIRQDSLAYVQHLALTWKPNTRRQRSQGVCSELKRFWDWQVRRRPILSPAELTLQDLQAYQTEFKAAGKKNTTINRRLDYVMGILRRRTEQEQPVHPSVFRLHILPRPESLPRHLSENECQQLEALLAASLSNPDSIISLQTTALWVLLHTGLRNAECTNLLVQDVDLASRRLIVRAGKGDRDRIVYLSDTACHALKNHLQHQSLDRTSPLWVLPNGKVMSQRWLQQRTTEVGLLLGIPDLQPHRLRHTFATRLLNAGMDVTRIQKLLGHDLLSTTMIYARIQDATVENDYRKAMHSIELQQAPLSNTPIPVSGLFESDVKVQERVDNSV